MVAFSPDGKRLASASRDQTVILWDLDSRKQLASLEGRKAAVLGVAFSPDGKRLASASADQTVILWDLDPESLRAEACRTANRNLTCDEWHLHWSRQALPQHLPGAARAVREVQLILQ